MRAAKDNNTCISLIPRPPSKRKGGFGEYSTGTSSHYGLAVAIARFP